MALAVEQHWPVKAPLEGLVITRYGHGLLTNRVKVIEAGHPVPDQAGSAAARESLRAARLIRPLMRMPSIFSIAMESTRRRRCAHTWSAERSARSPTPPRRGSGFSA